MNLELDQYQYLLQKKVKPIPIPCLDPMAICDNRIYAYGLSYCEVQQCPSLKDKEKKGFFDGLRGL
ncbi:hypothetical protein [Candidatus Lokiarchaeum ossiferum]|uniref:hypothetical protein n=1 Tax=Candidatus Lokiarchaeum ossiferum TaxID=2951803 RepID=UPI00352D4424